MTSHGSPANVGERGGIEQQYSNVTWGATADNTRDGDAELICGRRAYIFEGNKALVRGQKVASATLGAHGGESFIPTFDPTRLLV